MGTGQLTASASESDKRYQNCDKCGPALQLKNLCAELERLRELHSKDVNSVWQKRDIDTDKIYNEIGKRMKTSTLIVIFTITVAIVTSLLGVMFGIIQGNYADLKVLQQQLTDTKMIRVRIEARVETIDDRLDRLEAQLIKDSRYGTQSKRVPGSGP